MSEKPYKPPAEQHTNFWLTLTDKDTEILHNVKIRKILVFIIVHSYCIFVNFIDLGWATLEVYYKNIYCYVSFTMGLDESRYNKVKKH